MNPTTSRFGKSDHELFKTEFIAHTYRLERALNEKVQLRLKKHSGYMQRYILALIHRDLATPEAPNCATCPHRRVVDAIIAATGARSAEKVAA